MEIDYENESIEQLKALLAAREAGKRKEEIIRKLRGLNDPGSVGKPLEEETLAR